MVDVIQGGLVVSSRDNYPTHSDFTSAIAEGDWYIMYEGLGKRRRVG